MDRILYILIGGLAGVGLVGTSVVLYIFLTELWWAIQEDRRERRRLEAEKSFRGIK